MLYWIFKPLIQLTTRLYFRNFQVTGKDNIPAEGPYILVANHPATFMDALLIAAHTRKKLYFLSKSTVFKSRFVASILKRLNMIPIYRRQDSPKEMEKNKDSFEQCYVHLNQQKPILIFPEGVSIPQRKLQEIKTGAARLAIGAFEKGNTEISIVCIGMNYEKKAVLQTNAVMHIGKPILVKDFIRGEEHPRDAVKKLTAMIAKTLGELTVSIDEPETDHFVSRIEEIYKPLLVKELGFDKRDKSNDFFLARKIAEQVNETRKNDPWALHTIKMQVDEYFGLLQQYRVGDREMRRVFNRRFFLIRFLLGGLYLLLALPFFIYGFVANVFPYMFTSLVSRRLTGYHEFRVAISFAAGMLIYTGFYIGMLFITQAVFHSFWINLLFLASFPVMGLYAYSYLGYWQGLRKRWKVFRYLYQRTEEMSVLYKKRRNIIEAIHRLRSEPQVQ